MPKTTLCAVPSCGKIVRRREWCWPHYIRMLKHGDPLAGGTPKGELKRYLNEVVLNFQGDECLRWPYTLNGAGYGQIRDGYKKLLVNRVVCEEINGPPPTSLHEVAHSCGKGHLGCCNPGHLRWATRAENQADRIVHGTSNRRPIAPCKVDGCGDLALVKGWCRKHYSKLRRLNAAGVNASD